jgi:putative protease
MNNKIPELVAPAGSLQKLKYALAYGADAVYAGVPRFSLRARENQFDDNTLAEAVQYTHRLGKKIFLTLNIFPHNRKIAPFEKALKTMTGLKPDALILSDPGIIDMARELCPDIPLHLSTQANTVNWRSVKFWRDQGIRRIILSRELSIDEISEIRDRNPDIELEAFVHGAICVAYSGRCLLSNYFTNRDPNQGTCTNSCRWKYHVYQEQSADEPETILTGKYYIEEQDRPGEFLPVDEDEFGTYIMNSKDLCAIGLLDRMYNAGVDSFKIEGRTKSVYYLTIITRAYHRALNQIRSGQTVSEDLEKEVWAVANRDYITGFLEKNPGDQGENFRESHSGHQTHIFCGIIHIPDKSNGRIRINVRNRFEVGDELEIVSPESVISFTLDSIFTLDGRSVAIAHGGGEDVEIKNPGNIREFSLLRKKLKS